MDKRLTIKQFILHPIVVVIVVIEVIISPFLWQYKTTQFGITMPNLFWADIYIIIGVSITFSIFSSIYNYVKWYDKNIQ